MIYEKLVEIICEQFSLNEDAITMETSFIDDLGADSLDLVELTMAMEEEFDIPETSDEDLEKLLTVGDVVRYVSSRID